MIRRSLQSQISASKDVVDAASPRTFDGAIDSRGQI